MKCPFCHQDNDRVVDTRSGEEGNSIRRRRFCQNCERRFTTYERVETTTLLVVKSDGSRVPFDRAKLRQGIERACWKRNVSEEQISRLITEIESRIDQRMEIEVSTHLIGEMVMDMLRDLDEVAYVRFASVYRKFNDASDFAKELAPMLEQNARSVYPRE